MRIKKIGLFLIMIFSMLMLPIMGFAATESPENQQNTHKLFQVLHDISIEENVSLFSGALIYGEELTEGKIKVQYKDSTIEVEADNLQEIDSLSKVNTPEYISYQDNIEFSQIQTIRNQTLYGSSISNGSTIHITEGSFHVIKKDDLDYVVIGNAPHFIKSDDQNDKVEVIPEKDESEDKLENSNSTTQEDIQSSSLEEENVDAKYFLAKKNLPVFIDKDGQLVEVGEIIKNQIYPLLDSSNEWNIIQFGEYKGLVQKADTEALSEANLTNVNNSYSNQPNYFIPVNDLTVYDNSTGKLIPFGKINAGQEYNVAYDYGGKWIYIVFADRVGFVKSEEIEKQYFLASDKYFLANDNLPVFDNRSGKLIQVGELVAGQIYPRYESSPKWHLIQFGDYKAYVKKEGTEPASGNSIKNKNTSYTNQNQYFTAKKDIAVYDNSSGSLVPFGLIKEGQQFSVAYDYGGKWIYVIFSDRVGYVKKADITRGYFLTSDKYFRVLEEDIAIYDKRKGKIVQIGQLEKGQVYPRHEGSPQWHQIQYSNKKVFVRKAGTEPVDENEMSLPKTTYNVKNKVYIATSDITVYSNFNGKMTPIGLINQGELYHISHDYGGQWIYINFADRTGYISSDTVTAKKSFNNNHHYFNVLQDGVPIYDNRSGKLIKVGELAKGETYKREVSYSSPKWHAINYNGYHAFVPEEVTEPSKESNAKNWYNGPNNKTSLNLIAQKNVNVYDNSTGKLNVIATILKGQKYSVSKDYGGEWLFVNIANRTGFVKNSEVKKEKVVVYKNIVNPRQVYTYKMMESDIKELAQTYPSLISWTTIGKSVDGRNLYAVKLGKGKKEVYFNGSTHAREWLTTNLLMEMIDEYSQAYAQGKKYAGYDVKKILDNTSIWFVPMVNPDGVTLVQEGPYRFKNPLELIKLNNGSTDFKGWKANIRGIDLNRQFPTDWNHIVNDPGRPSSQNFKGYKPLSEPETVALRNFSKAHNFKTEVAYHSSGEILYFGDDKFAPNSYMFNLSKRIANMVSAKTGYRLYYTRGLPGGGTYTDWVQGEMNRVGLTPEISPYVGNRPVPVSSFNAIWNENNTIGLMIAKEALERK